MQDEYDQKNRVLVLGGTGFIGRHIVAALLAQNVQTTIGTRSPKEQATNARPSQLSIRLQERTNPEDWADEISNFDVIINCVGILRPQRGASYDAVHHLAPAALAHACANTSTRLIHVSAIGLGVGDRSGFLTSKLRGEQAIANSGSDWIIVRPSLLDGKGGFGARWLRAVAKLPFFIVPRGATGQIAAMTASDLGEAMTNICLDTSSGLRLDESRIFELGGTATYTFRDYIQGLRRNYGHPPAFVFLLPNWLTRLGAHLCDLFHFSPFSFGHWELLQKDNVAKPNRLPELLQRPPKPVITSSD
ncbi:MAG: NAD(P)H-binding protein [Pseudomonadales bacterium]|nr:NAD(P)H-binding protein [Pseudomonadales bacterium]